MKQYISRRLQLHHRPWRPYGAPPPPPTYQCVRAYPEDCSCVNKIAIVGEGPGEDEDQSGFPFTGRSGEELDRFLDTHGIDPDKCIITNIGRVFRFGNPDPLAEDIEIWESLLHEELNIARPYWIAAIGRISTRYFLGDVDMDAVHGIPYRIVLPWLDNGRGGSVVVIPVVHPAAGFHSPDTQAVIAYDFAQLGSTVDGRLTPRDPETHDAFPEPDYRDLTNEPADIATIVDTLAGGSRTSPIPVAIDTEGLPGNPWGLSYSIKPGQAFVIRKVHGNAITAFYYNLIVGITEGRIHVILHNSLHDLRVLRELGIPLPDGSYTDTMVLSYHLCIEPQGLKALAYRHAGMEMDSYPEIVQEAQDRIAVEYYESIEGMVEAGTIYTQPEKVYWEFKVQPKPPKKVKIKAGSAVITIQQSDTKSALSWCDERLTETEALAAIAEYGKEYRCSKPKKVTIPASGPVNVGPFRYIEPYTLLERDKETGQLRERTKTPQQIDRRVRAALAALREGKIDAAQLRTRWEGTDDLVVDVVEEVLGPMREAGLDDVPLPRSIKYAARDADATIRVFPVLKERHSSMSLERVGTIDHNTIPMVDRMQAIGLAIDKPYMEWLSGDLARRALGVQNRIKEQFGVWINPNSGEQVADLLYRPVEEGGYGLVATKKTKGSIDKETGEVKNRRGSTVDKVLEGLRNEHPIVPLILEYRGLHKAKTSFVDVAIRRARWEKGAWVVHCLFRITRVSSGRLSATGPNLMAIMGGVLGAEIRRGYIAGDGFEFAEWDLDQIEMRGMASESGDEFLIGMFMRGEDVHTGTADKMFKLNLPRPYKKSQTKAMKLPSGVSPRDPAKRTGFGVITGIQPPGLVDQMRLQGIIITEEEALQWITDWFAACPAVPDYMFACHREAKAYGYVRDWAGRIRYLPGIHSPFKHIRAEAGRQSHSHKIQGGAQETMKTAMHHIWTTVLPYWWEQGIYVEPVLQIHDALMIRRDKNMTQEQKQELDAQIRAALFSAAPPGFKVPLDAGHVCGTDWGELEH